MRPLSVTVPTAAPSTSHRSHTASTAARSAGATTHSIRSWDSLTITSNGSMSGSRSGTRATSMSIPTSPLEAISAAAEVRPAAPRSCSATSSPRSSNSSEHSSSFFSSNGSPTWTLGRRSWAPSSSSAEASTDAPDAVAPRRGAEQDEQVAGPGGGAADELLAPGEAEGHRVDEAVVLVGPLEVDLAADRGHPDRVAVVPDPRHRAVEEVARALAGRLPEAQRVEHRHRPRPDREDVPQDPADAGGGALERLDCAGVVVGLDLEGAHEPGADVDGAGVLARAHDHERALRGQRPKQLAGVLVGAVLAPQQRVHRQLDLVRRTPLLGTHELVLRPRQPQREGVRERWQRRALRHAHPREPAASSGRCRGRRSSRP